MKSFDKIKELENRLYKQGISSHDDLKKLSNIYIEKLFATEGITSLLKEDVVRYLDWLFLDHPYRYHKKIVLEKMTELEMNWSSSFLLALFAGNEEAYRNLPLTLSLFINNLDIKKYKYASVDDIVTQVYKNYDINFGMDNNKIICEPKFEKVTNNYHRFDSNYDCININNKEEFAIWSEHRSYEEEVKLLKKHSDYVRWVSRDYGDGYGFDILSIDLDNNKEKLINVKASKSSGLALNEHEVKVMRSCGFKNAEYYIYKWTYDALFDSISLNIYHYDSKKDLIVDNDGNKYFLRNYQVIDNNGEMSYRYAIDKLEVKTKH